MKTYPLAAVRSLRIKKEDEAIRKLTAARLDEEIKREKVKEAQKALDDYLLWMKNEAERLFASILGKEKHIHEVTEVTNQIAWNRSQQATYVVALEDAGERLREAEIYTAACIKEQESAYKNVWKIDRHRDVWAQDEKVREEYEEEGDLEEIAAIIFSMS
ncbi:MAG: YscO family type III secretion system apparatus protein [Chthoniobacterales bacterium]